jgi:hypothetical protein
LLEERPMLVGHEVANDSLAHFRDLLANTLTVVEGDLPGMER